MKQIALLLLIVLGIGVGAANSQWIKQNVATTASFRGLSVVNEKIIWASGTEGTVIRTIDGGKTWEVIQVPDAAKLDFRDIEAFDANTAYILSIGNGESSRIYKTTDGGKTWKEQFRNKNENAFYDAIACAGRYECFAMSDPVNGSFPVIGTLDGGTHWQPWTTRSRPIAGEAAFAASGTCMIIDRERLFLVSGGTRASVYRLELVESSGRFERVDTPIISGSAGSGIFSIAMRDAKNGIIVGGNYEKPDEAKDNIAFTTDGGKTWKLATGLNGYRSGVAYVDKSTIIAVGTNGSDISIDGGKTWRQMGVLVDEARAGGGRLVTEMMSPLNLNAVGSRGKRATFAVGPNGGVYKLK